MEVLKDWKDRVDGQDEASAEDVNELARTIKTVAKAIDGSGSAETTTPIIELDEYTTNKPTLETNKIYMVEVGIMNNSWEFVFPSDIDRKIQNQILIYFKTYVDCSVLWGENVVFVGDEIANISVGNYRVIVEYNPNLSKWVIGVIQDGAEGGVS